RFEEIEPQQARALLESAMKATGEPKTPPPVSDSYSAYHAFARSRLKALPPGRKRPAPLHIEAPYNRERRAMLAAELLASDAGEPKRPPPVGDSYSAYHAFAGSRLKALPPGRKRPAPLHIEAPYNRERRAMLAAEFLASDAAEHLSDPSAASRCADHIIDYGC